LPLTEDEAPGERLHHRLEGCVKFAEKFIYGGRT
jgi:hypothetical protein